MPYSPSLIGQLGFYSKRLKNEQSVRRIGLVFIILAMVVQLFAAVVPAEKSLAASDTNLINGIKTKADILRAWDAKGSDIHKIYGYFGVSRDDISSASFPDKPNVTLKSNAADYWSVGRLSLSGFSNIADKYKNSEKRIDTEGTTVYMRQLKAWDIKNPYNTYKAFQGKKASTGETFWIVVDCGNYVQVGPPKTEKPALEIRKTIISNYNNLKPGDKITYRIEYRNKIPNTLAQDVTIEDQLDLVHFQVVSPDNLPVYGNVMRLKINSLPYSPAFQILDITVRLNDNLPNNTKVCNASSIVASNATAVTSSGSGLACATVMKPCPYNPNIPDDGQGCKVPVAACDTTIFSNDPLKHEVSLRTNVISTDPSNVRITKYNYDFGDGQTKSVSNSALQDNIKHIYNPGTYQATVTILYTINDKQSTSKQATCSANVQINPDQPVGLAKTVKNITQNLEGTAALQSKVKANDIIEFSLITSNTQSFDKPNYSIDDYIGDLQDYADLDTDFLTQQGGAYNATDKKVVWLNQTLKANSDNVKMFRIKMKDPIPSTNSPTALSTTFDCKISNQYGNELTMDVTCPIIKNVETLPNTGPGTTIIAAFSITVLGAYFFARSRLLAKELQIIRRGQATLGGI